MNQQKLFRTDASLPPGMIYRAEFITVAEEASLLKEIHALPLEKAKYKQFTLKRRIISYGGSFEPAPGKQNCRIDGHGASNLEGHS